MQLSVAGKLLEPTVSEKKKSVFCVPAYNRSSWMTNVDNFNVALQGPTVQCPRGGWRITSGTLDVIVCPTATEHGVRRAWQLSPLPQQARSYKVGQQPPPAVPIAQSAAVQVVPSVAPMVPSVGPAPALPTMVQSVGPVVPNTAIANATNAAHIIMAADNRFYAEFWPQHPRQFHVEFVQDDAVGGFECSLDGAPFAPCTSPQMLSYPGLAAGRHVFQVRVPGQAERPAQVEFNIAASDANRALITSAEANEQDVGVTFDGPVGAVFECSLDAADFQPCVSPQQATGVPAGPHVLRVRIQGQTTAPDEFRWQSETDTGMRLRFFVARWIRLRACLAKWPPSRWLEDSQDTQTVQWWQSFEQRNARLNTLLRLPLPFESPEMRAWAGDVFPNLIDDPLLLYPPPNLDIQQCICDAFDWGTGPCRREYYRITHGVLG